MTVTGIFNQRQIHTSLYRESVWYQLIDKDGQIIYLNEYAQKLSGYSFEEISNKNLFWEKLFRTRESGLRFHTLYQNLIKRKKNIGSSISEITAKCGKKHTLCWTLQCNCTASGQSAGATIIGIRLSSQEKQLMGRPKSSENRYRKIFRNAPIGFFRTTPEGKFIEVNNALATLLGYSAPEEVLTAIKQIGDDVYQHPDFRHKVVEKTLGSNRVHAFETVFIDRFHNPVDVRINISSRYDAGLDDYILEGTLENISARKAAERQLQDNLLKYSTLFEKSPIAIMEIDYAEMKSELDRLQIHPDSVGEYFEANPDQLETIRKKVKIIDINQAGLALFGAKNTADFTSMHYALTNKPLTDAECKTMQCFIKNVTSFENEAILHESKNGNKNIIIRWVAAPDTIKPYSKVLVTMIDITQQRTEHEALSKNKNELATLLSSMDDQVFIISQEGKFLYVAPNRPDLLSSSAKELEGSYLHQYFGPEPETRLIKGINESIEKNKTLSIDYPITLQGREYWFEAKISPLTSKNVIVVARDITQRVNTQKTNEVMLNIARAVSATDKLNELFDLIRSELSKIIDTRNFFLALFNADTNTLTLPYFRDEKDNFDHFPAEKTFSEIVIREKKTLFLNEAEIMKLAKVEKINLTGSVAKVWLGIPLMVDGEVLGLMVVQNYEHENAIRHYHKQLLEVISPHISQSIKRKQNEQLLRESEKQLRESNATKDRFFNIIAHDLKNPFNAIIGFTSLLTDEWNEFDDDDKVAMISSIKSSSEGAFELLMNLLDWSRLQVGKFTFEPEFTDLKSLIRLNFSLLQTAAEKKCIKLVNTGMCDKMIWADPNMIKTVIRNLITNAIKFTPDNGTITVSCQKYPEHPGMMLLAIQDNGVGITESQLKNLFVLSHSESKRGTDGETGTGLGLVLCKEFIEKNKGQIWVESTPGTGSTFYVALPVCPS